MNTLIKNKKEFFIIIGSVAMALAMINFVSFFGQSATDENVILNFIYAGVILTSAIMLLVSGIKDKYEPTVFISEILLASSIIVRYLSPLISSATYSTAVRLCIAIAYLVFLVLTFKNEKYQIVKKVFTYILGTFFFLEIVSNGTFLSMACLLILVGSLFNFNGKKENKNEN